MKWTCKTCNEIDFNNGNEEDERELCKELTQELENQQAIIETLSDDLFKANEEITNLKCHTHQLETLVLKKEETIELLEREISELNNKNKSEINKVHLGQQTSLPVIITTPSGSKTRPRAWSSEKHFSNNSSTVLKNKKPKNQNKVYEQNDSNIFISKNRYDVLSTKIDGKTHLENKKTKALQEKNKNKRILICADSHGRDLFYNLNKILSDHEAVSFIRPGGCTKEILDMYNIEEEKLSYEDTLVIISGTNDVATNDAQEATTSITSVLEKKPNHKVVLVELPHRYDLVDWSCVNKEVTRTNAQFKQLSEQLDNVTLVELSKAERSLHTRHGMHFNSRGKNWLAEQIAKAVRGCSKHGAAHTSNTNNNEVFGSSDHQTPDVRHKPSGNSLPLPTTPPDQLETENITRLT
ncbi:hypothetical protein J6590_076048 [Homalodisca vitripennis]|nr:hypothetical protein J6590_076048 [Homalodisca vitripennis]